MGSRRMWFCPIGLTQLPMSSVLAMVFLPFSSCKIKSPFLTSLFYQLRSGLKIHVQLGVGILPIVDKAFGDVNPWSPLAKY